MRTLQGRTCKFLLGKLRLWWGCSAKTSKYLVLNSKDFALPIVQILIRLDYSIGGISEKGVQGSPPAKRLNLCKYWCKNQKGPKKVSPAKKSKLIG